MSKADIVKRPGAIQVRDNGDIIGIGIYVPPAMVNEFKKMVARSMNTWPDCSVEMRDFYDRLMGRARIMGDNMKWQKSKLSTTDDL